MGSALNAGLLCLWAGLLGYVCVLAPNQTPTIDAFVVQKLVGLKAEDPFQVNEVFTCVWNFMGLYPLIYAALLIPAARSNRLPAWPFVSASVFLGAYALLPYMCLWTPKSPPQQLRHRGCLLASRLRLLTGCYALRRRMMMPGRAICSCLKGAAWCMRPALTLHCARC